MSELMLISVTGEDKPGITATVARLLGEHDIDILDVGQSVIHNQLSLGILASIPAGADIVFEELKNASRQVDVNIRFTPVSAASYDEWVGLQGRSRYILTLLARRIRAAHIAEVSNIIRDCGLNIDNITRLSGRVPLLNETLVKEELNEEFSEKPNAISGEKGGANTRRSPGQETKACVEFSLRGEADNHFREKLLAVCSDLDIDIAVQEDGIYRRNRRLIAFDMDSTLIKTEVIDELAKIAGVGEEVALITESAMNGHLDFRESLRKRVALLRGLKEEALVEIAARLPLTEGVEHLFKTLNHLGYKTAILSGGFDYFGRVLQAKLGVDYVFANTLVIENGVLTGEVREPIVDAERKATLLREIAARENISLEQTIAVGDGANDLAMLDIAGLGIAFHAKPIVRKSAGHSISTLGLDSLLYLMGIRDRDAVNETRSA